MSVRPSTSVVEAICSGDMYCGEPKTRPDSVVVQASPSSFGTFEIPKSRTFRNWPPLEVGERNMFAGFRSR